MPLVEGPAAQLARRLRDLRVKHWRDRNITQAQLADALAGSGRRPSVPSISSWENPANPALPPVRRLESYATFFATARSVERRPYRLLGLSELTAAELATREQLLNDLTALHAAAKAAPSAAAPAHLPDSVLRFPPGEGIVLVCAPLPAEARKHMPQPDPVDPDHIDLYDYGDLDALMELYGRLSALNPDSPIQRVLSDNLTPEHFVNHLIILGGVDFNAVLRDLVERASAPIRQIPRDTTEDLGGFEVETAASANNDSPTFEPQVLDIDGQSQVGEDVAQIYYGPNPYTYQERNVMSFNGQFARGTLGAVRALTDPHLRDQNEAYLRERFGNAREWTLLTKVVIVEGQPITPAWSISDTRLYTWPERRASRG
ncbi:MAG TPA: helix-turn-helix transcriptional regulator [Pseudonocardiaceae bacterium]